MERFSGILVLSLLLGGTALAAGCGSSAGGLVTGTTKSEIVAADAPGKVSNEDPLARPIAVAWTSARAHRCGFYFDPNKLRTSYLAYESKQSGGEQLAKAEKTYDSTFKAIRERVGGDPDYCSDKKGTEIKADLQRHLSGDFAPNFPKVKVVESCGFFGCPVEKSEEPFDAKKLFQDLDKKQNK